MSKRRNSLCMYFAPFVVLLCSARPCQSSFALQPLKVSIHHAQPYIVFIWFAHLCSPYSIKSERVSAYLLPPLQSPNTLRTYAVSIHLANLKSLHHVTQPYAVSIVPERLCRLRMNKSGKVFAYSFALAVSIHCAHLNSPTTSRAYQSPFAPCTSAVLV